MSMEFIGPLSLGNQVTIGIEDNVTRTVSTRYFWEYKDGNLIETYAEFQDNANPPSQIILVRNDPLALPQCPDEPLGAPGDDRVLTMYASAPRALPCILRPCQCGHRNSDPAIYVNRCRAARGTGGYAFYRP